MAGYLKVYRKFFDHWLWREQRALSKAEAWIDLLQLAAYAPTKRTVRDKLIRLEQGEMLASVRYLATRWQWGKDRVSTFLRLLESDEMIRRETRQGETLISVCNYASYANGADTGTDTPPQAPPTVPRQCPDKEEEGEEGKEGEIWAAGPPSLCSLAQALSYAPSCFMTPEEASHWWHTRDAGGWLRGTSGGGAARRITSWQSDMKASMGWVRETLAKTKNGKNARAC